MELFGLIGEQIAKTFKIIIFIITTSKRSGYFFCLKLKPLVRIDMTEILLILIVNFMKFYILF